MHKAKSIIIDLMLLFIITIPAFIRILNNQYFSMHDDQHIVRLFLLDQGLRQGYLYPRWVDGLGFGFGYPLYNFYPALVYYVAETFHLLGFSFIWAVKLTFILGFYIGALGIYLLLRKFTNRLSAFLSASLYTYFFYHAVLIYVRGALAEFFSLAVLPYVFLTLYNLSEKHTFKQSTLFGITLALLILTHPLMALPSMIFIGLLFLFFLVKMRFNPSISLRTSLKFVYLFICGLFFGLALSAFFWFPSMIERQFTLTDKILTSELASYKLYYIYPQQFIYSPWGYGGSGVGLSDGMTFQLGKIHIGLAVGAVLISLIIIIKRLSFRRIPSTRESEKSSVAFLRPDKIGTRFLASARNDVSTFFFFVFLLLFSLFLTTNYSSFIWDRVKYLWYLQFPWRFLTFTAIFISIVGGYFIYFLSILLQQSVTPDRWNGVTSHSRESGNPELYRFRIKSGMTLAVITIIIFTIFTYQKYFKPQRIYTTSDKERTTFEEIAWRISRTSYEFVPKGVKTKKSELNTTLLAIEKKDLPKKPYEIISGKGNVTVLKNKFQDKEFLIDAKTPLTFRLNTYNFPRWKAYINSKSTNIHNNNDFKLITVNMPSGKNNLQFKFENTNVRKVGNLISLGALIFLTWALFYKFKKVDG